MRTGALLMCCLCALTLGCDYARGLAPAGGGTFLGTRSFTDYEELGPRVEGKSCIRFRLFGSKNIHHAYRDALANAPEGTTGLANVRLSHVAPFVFWMIPLTWISVIVGVPECLVVQGTPVRAVVPLAAHALRSGRD